MNKTQNKWLNNRQAAISLSYDDGIPNHPLVVAPQLEAYGLRGTFYAPLKSDLMQNPLTWRSMAVRGHELGNHSVFHPCWSVQGKYDSWLEKEFNLVNYNAQQWLDEINTANQALALVDGRNQRTFGNNCFDNYLGPEDAPVCLEPMIAQVFLAARGEDTEKPVDLVNIDDFTDELNQLLETGGWIIYTFHGVGEEAHTHHINAREHERLLSFLRDNEQNIWTAPVIEVVRWLKR
jgi:peptidoglycan/xylan/chitin deacetylase (PgdA/CDA1 family)